MFNYRFREIQRALGEDADSALASGRARLARAAEPIDLAFVVGAIRGHAPELADDLDEAITVWLGQTHTFVVDRGEPTRLSTRRSRLQALRELLSLSPYEPDSRD